LNPQLQHIYNHKKGRLKSFNKEKEGNEDMLNNINEKELAVVLEEVINDLDGYGLVVTDDIVKWALLAAAQKIKEKINKKDDKKLYLLFKCDEWKSKHSMELISVLDDIEKSEQFINELDLRENGLEYFDIVEIESYQINTTL
jgi:hypothetical protein